MLFSPPTHPTHRCTHTTQDLYLVGQLKAEKKPKGPSVLEIMELLLFPSSNAAQSAYRLSRGLPHGWVCSASFSPWTQADSACCRCKNVPILLRWNLRGIERLPLSPPKVWTGCSCWGWLETLNWDGPPQSSTAWPNPPGAPGISAAGAASLGLPEGREGGSGSQDLGLSVPCKPELSISYWSLQQSGIFVPRPFPLTEESGRLCCLAGNL